ncbi:DUF2721 domain-containing protein [Synoicihabitans lomoniglobus]|uniref:DUF2721 domain-containing protein n=1 Tax=Synoicihabitans lomoniglobus TaxID=2909285 RepID=A0AAF0CPF6_9BACT|nr:DUF2721 domain-containing protein [Opitutaceae bacterium LMO-M01]WED64489.1 DUF2721 domain-containing protein [Opitutaceae bacterium LMO-M01]
MNPLTLHELLPVLQLAIGPVILISGVGLLMLTVTNRFGRVVDRSRVLARELAGNPPPPEADRIRAQLQVFDRRAAFLRASCMLLAVTILSAALLILMLFVASLAGFEQGIAIVLVFAVGQLALIGSVIMFIRDINLSLAALRLETQPR